MPRNSPGDGVLSPRASSLCWCLSNIPNRLASSGWPGMFQDQWVCSLVPTAFPLFDIKQVPWFETMAWGILAERSDCPRAASNGIFMTLDTALLLPKRQSTTSPVFPLTHFFFSGIQFQIPCCIWLCLLSLLPRVTASPSFLVFPDLDTLKSTSRLFCTMSLNWVCLMFPP